MSKPLKLYTVTFHDTLRVQVEAYATNPEAARSFAIKQWSDALWERADPTLEDTTCIILESFSRNYFEITEDDAPTLSTNES
ncbi:protein of unknown function [Candidatus Filomicrobium marinum]|uniref:Uncharacterized protein n=1 Tax=Candidatus Filomicrobium marinum TaxID=1608628 RepID=A0A0D6JBU6_9HYPH|nr:hypothetical protein [Candidatus Filomicrobium marinum]CFX04400.1 protein of unknown function [Candidatus Filomicrobium marinum]CPR16042.1 protein of unknown function [Candidatus Filomicrobium marinum]